METSLIQERVSRVINDFNQLPDWEERYKKLIEWGKNLPPLSEEFKTDKYLIKGCQSQVWLYPDFIQGQVIFRADSDAILVKGIVALLLYVYSTSSPAEILETKPDFLTAIGLTEHLSMNRTNGLKAMIKQIQLYALAYGALSGKKI